MLNLSIFHTYMMYILSNRVHFKWGKGEEATVPPKLEGEKQGGGGEGGGEVRGGGRNWWEEEGRKRGEEEEE